MVETFTVLHELSSAERVSTDRRPTPGVSRPIPILRLFATGFVGLGEEVPDGDLVPVATLTFDYGGTRIRATDPATRILRHGAYGLESIPRDTQGEAHACRLLERIGAIDLGCVDAFVPSDDADYVIAPFGGSSERCHFTARLADDLVPQGFVIEVDPAYPYQIKRVDDAAWEISILKEENLPDWFGLEMGVSLDGEKINLLPLLLDLVDAAADDDDLRAVERAMAGSYALRISPTHSISFPAKRFKALLRVLVELYQGTTRGKNTLRFSASRAGAAERLIDTVTDAAGSVVLKGTRPKKRVREATPRPPAALDASRALRAELRPYQEVGVAFLGDARLSGDGCVLADDMGLGKTLQTIAHLNAVAADSPALIVAPTSLAFNWAREVDKFAPHLDVVVVNGPRRREAYDRMAKADIVVTTYPVIVRDVERFEQIPFSTIVLDEAQAIKNVASQTHKALRRLQSEHRICLTGTPIENDLGELWALFHFLTPDLLGEEPSFKERFRVPIEQRGDEIRLDALREIVKPHVLRRRKTDVVPELPPKTELYRPVELDGKQRELYEQIRVAAHSDVRKAIRKKGLAASTISILDAITKLRQVCCDPRLVSLDEARKVKDSAKIDAFFGLVANELQQKRRILVFSQFTSMLALMAKGLDERGIDFVSLTGQTQDRAAVCDQFESGKVDVFLISLKAGGTGLNLTSADTVIHYDPWWNPASQVQATARAYRIGQKKPVFVHHLYVAGSVEERVLLLQKRKAALASAILGDPVAQQPGLPTREATDAGHGLSELDVERLLAPLDG